MRLTDITLHGENKCYKEINGPYLGKYKRSVSHGNQHALVFDNGEMPYTLNNSGYSTIEGIEVTACPEPLVAAPPEAPKPLPPLPNSPPASPRVYLEAPPNGGRRRTRKNFRKNKISRKNKKKTRAHKRR